MYVSSGADAERSQELLQILFMFHPFLGQMDEIVREKNVFKFVVKLSYQWLQHLCNAGLLIHENFERDLASLWKTKASRKILIFWWRLLLNTLPIKIELAKREIIQVLIIYFVRFVLNTLKILIICFLVVRNINLFRGGFVNGWVLRLIWRRSCS